MNVSLSLLLLLLAVLHHQTVDSFTTATNSVGRGVKRTTTARWNTLPTVQEVSQDDFMKQLGHTARILPLLHPTNGTVVSQEELNALRRVLEEQFKHSEGIRGFFAVYLTSSESLLVEENDDDDNVPRVLREAIVAADPKIMVPLACMNVVMPTAMTSLHTHPDLKECAAKTANNGKKILRLLRGNRLMMDNCRAIARVCDGTAGVEEEELIKYWDSFFCNYKYGPMEKEAIALAMAEFC
ncbi:hypothetical protein HJC23_000210 [Cyclotella cryptica]|uniref:Uncharacterized protein n=1 Tax=Cyclotella cryptica TaxID=29204 RepID=A0ABD3QEP6_9STRA|eukprot:CCRYP_006389-RA/>CCRYP_006389-RA protein AED:0.08 eAED:0.08 QI:99/1/1/1/1/1/4/670/239